MLQCYNRGCGQKFDPNDNKDDSCCHHPGAPYFHDAYKGWTCCNKKSVDFTEFLNYKGCTLSKHSSEKPPEPEKPSKEVEIEKPTVEQIREPVPISMKRPPFDSPMTKITPEVMPSLKQAIDNLKTNLPSKETKTKSNGEVPIGTTCKNGGCSASYTSPDSNDTQCQHHPGVPIFHEGLKFWSCCQKRTSDFQAFLEQKGCTFGKHKWLKDDDGTKSVTCRYDWHQTATNVHISIYAKLYHYELSSIRVNPVRLTVSLVFPEQENATFDLDMELRGIIKVEGTIVKMHGTKVEITMPKAEAGSWAKLDFPRAKVPESKPLQPKSTTEADSDSDVDLDDIEAVSHGVKISEIS